MPASLPDIDFAWLRSQVIGADAMIRTPYGERPMVYADYTASGRCLLFIENYLQSILRIYANTHTEDDITGRSMTRLLHAAEARIKQAVNAGPDGRVIAVGTGASGAIDKLQQIIGVAWPPATRRRVEQAVAECLGPGSERRLIDCLRDTQPVVFVGPYEHHSNEISWRQGLATVIETGLAADGGIDLADLERLLKLPQYQDRPRIGSFSAASNVTGMRSPVPELAALLHEHGALACFDFAASAPYVPIDMNPPPLPGGRDASLDAIFISPHKFVGGPGSAGLLVFNRRIYDEQLPPTVAAGGTVDYVSPEGQDFIRDIEEREKAGTPGVLQTIKAAMAFMVKDELGVDRIEARETELLERALARWLATPGIELLGNPDPARRIAILSFNIRCPGGSYLHPKLVTALLNDLFGIQSRAGCSCAGPYGHRLLGIDMQRSQQYRRWILKGIAGIKPGWCRVGFHFTMDDLEAGYLIEAVSFLAEHGHRFVGEYDFDLHSGAWTHRRPPTLPGDLSLEAALRARGCEQTALPEPARREIYRACLEEARELAATLPPGPDGLRLPGELADLQFFTLQRPPAA